MMSNIMVDDLKNYLRVDDDSEDKLIETILEASKRYIRNYTGQTDEALDGFEDIPIAVFALCADMYDVRQVAVANDKENPVVAQILGSYSINLI